MIKSANEEKNLIKNANMLIDLQNIPLKVRWILMSPHFICWHKQWRF